MKMFKKNKRAFTLVEVMTAIAIITLIMGLFVSLVVGIKESYYRTYTSNDAADYAYLYSQALENYIIKNAEQHPGTEYKYEIDVSNNSAFLCDGVAPFNLAQMTNSEGECKWNVFIEASSGGNGLISYTLYLVDNFHNPGELVMTYSSSFWIPSHGSTQKAPTITITHDGSAVTSTNWSDYGNQLTENHSSIIKVTGTAITIPTTAGSGTSTTT